MKTNKPRAAVPVALLILTLLLPMQTSALLGVTPGPLTAITGEPTGAAVAGAERPTPAVSPAMAAHVSSAGDGLDAFAILQNACGAIVPGSEAAERATFCADLRAHAASPADFNSCFADASAVSCLGAFAIDAQETNSVLPVGREVGPAGEGGFAAGCYWSDLRIALVYAALGCSAATSFSAQASFSFSFLLWSYSFDMGVGAAGCGGLAAGTTGYSPHVECRGWVTAGNQATFNCSDSAGILSSYAIACIKTGFAAGETECAEASATGHASNLPLTIEVHEAHASGTSGKCDETIAELLDIGLSATSANAPVQRVFLPDELPADLVDQVRADLVGQFYEQVDAELSSGEHTPVEKLMLLQVASGIEQDLRTFEFPPLVGTLSTDEA